MTSAFVEQLRQTGVSSAWDDDTYNRIKEDMSLRDREAKGYIASPDRLRRIIISAYEEELSLTAIQTLELLNDLYSFNSEEIAITTKFRARVLSDALAKHADKMSSDDRALAEIQDLFRRMNSVSEEETCELLIYDAKQSCAGCMRETEMQCKFDKCPAA